MREALTAYVALGANLGDAAQAVRDACTRLGELDGTRLVRQSSLYRSAPVDSQGPDYINAVAELATRLTALELLAQLQRLELAAGRERPYRNAPRTLDLDLLLYGDARIDSPQLQVPHPRMNQRAFVLVPLAEIAPQLVPASSLQAVAGQSLTRLPPG
ncbi:2-amino-4-hydroxy-6-hydroxymethyldihydropteridine diphosphokinase [Caenimonas soli]|uniref:2-amino-4-hydroxy-6- hydroxymethyldihydropteridine diphosphokinase n=1 Tax=Caenimonas soli TaxID=2735555 RepID=UPI001552D570|nr:2-amino-4-hydroxy-6-hydroxymethyldihydropteridine diphosphokinase [Caenimonas soli]NPC56277.1 2-amino-4-hydroxy-6-hydroxymethyldihydropteridine diphosphokinase [Caenimonas soli]